MWKRTYEWVSGECMKEDKKTVSFCLILLTCGASACTYEMPLLIIVIFIIMKSSVFFLCFASNYLSRNCYSRLYNCCVKDVKGAKRGPENCVRNINYAQVLFELENKEGFANRALQPSYRTSSFFPCFYLVENKIMYCFVFKEIICQVQLYC